MLYHIFLEYTAKKGKQESTFLYNFPEDEMIRSIATPYMENRPIFTVGEFVSPSNIEKIEIFKSQKPFRELTLPNRKSPIDEGNHRYTYNCFCRGKVEGLVSVCTHQFITSPPKEKPETPELTNELMKSASFLELNTNWSLATCALQLQEVAITLVAEKKKIKLDKANVERILNKEITGELSFNDRYRAFSKQVKASFKIEMPRLTTLLRKMRTEVLHQGYNPTPEETESITSFTIGLLKKLDACIEKPLPYIHLQD